MLKETSLIAINGILIDIKTLESLYFKSFYTNINESLYEKNFQASKDQNSSSKILQ